MTIAVFGKSSFPVAEAVTNPTGDTYLWSVTGEASCDVAGCSRPADIIADTPAHERFCSDHALEAAEIPRRNPAFGGWYRVKASQRCRRCLRVRVYPLSA